MKLDLGRILGVPILILQIAFSGFAISWAGRDDVDVSGTWAVTVETPQGTGTPTLVLKQEGEKVTGTYKGRLGESKVEGTIKSNEIKFSVTLKFQDQESTITYTGTAEKDAMKGTAQFGEFGSGAWTAKRKQD